MHQTLKDLEMEYQSDYLPNGSIPTDALLSKHRDIIKKANKVVFDMSTLPLLSGCVFIC